MAQLNKYGELEVAGCPECGNPIKPHWKACPECGQRLDQTVSSSFESCPNSSDGVRPGEGIGMINLDMSEAEIVKLLGSPDDYKVYDRLAVWQYRSRGVCIQILDGRVASVVVVLRQGLHDRYIAYDGNLGLGLIKGARWADVVRLLGYPDATERIPIIGFKQRFSSIRYDKGVFFEFDWNTDEVATIGVSAKRIAEKKVTTDEPSSSGQKQNRGA